MAAAICEHIKSCKEVVSASLRSPALYQATIAKMPSDQRQTLTEFSQRLHDVMAKEAHAKKVDVVLLFTQAVCGKMARPAASDEIEVYPTSTVPGLVQGDDGLMMAFLNNFASVQSFLQRELLNGSGRDSPQPTSAFDVLSAANMLWCTRFPSDYEAFAKDASRPRHQYDPASAASANGKSRDDLGKKMKQLLMLNLRLQHPPDTWVPLLEFRDASIDGMNKLVAIPGTPPAVFQIVENYSAAVNAVQIHASPAEIAEYLESRLAKVKAATAEVNSKGSAYVCRQLVGYVQDQSENLAHVVAECVPPPPPQPPAPAPSPPAEADGEAQQPTPP